MLENLEEFIKIPTLANDEVSNKLGISYISTLLKDIGFSVSVEGNSPYHQPTVIARYNSINSLGKVVLYAHYDVEPVNINEEWISINPFKIKEINGRLYGRGIADNKGPLIARIQAIKEMLLENKNIPSILWLIQGEEEVQGSIPFTAFPNALKNFNSKYFIEETGYHNQDTPKLFILPKTINKEILNSLKTSLYNDKVEVEYRTLNKVFTKGKCPFLSIIPDNAYYLGFGPNDEHSAIHKSNESLNKEKLIEHITKFKIFLSWIDKNDKA